MRCRGMRDLLPDGMARFRRIEQVFRDVCLGWGYEEVRTPTIEHLHLFTSAGTLSPRMLARVYSFLDWDGWSGERVVLRPDSTIPVARLYIEQCEPGAIKRLFYVQNVLRFAQGDESREDWQCGIELIGDSQPLGDVELILIASEIFDAVGVAVEVKLSDPGILRAVLQRAGLDMPEQLAVYDRILDGDLSVLDEIAERIGTTGIPLRPLLSMEGDSIPYLNNLRSTLLPSVPELDRPLSELLSVSDVLSEIGHRHTISPLLVRNFEYYTGPVSHFYAGDVRVGGGGRYDALVGLVGGVDVPASGVALEMELLVPLIAAVRDQTGKLVIRPKAAARGDIAAAFGLAATLRNAGRSFRMGGVGQESDAPEVIATQDGYMLRVNGARPRRIREPGDVLRALGEAGL